MQEYIQTWRNQEIKVRTHKKLGDRVEPEEMEGAAEKVRTMPGIGESRKSVRRISRNLGFYDV